MILTSYFTSKPHPQRIDPSVYGVGRDGHVLSDHFKYMEEWYESVDSLKIPARIFHDGLSSKFCKKYKTKHIRFYNVGKSAGKYSLNDSRFLFYHSFFQRMVWPSREKIDWIFTTDISDVVVKKDPGQLILGNPTVDIFAGGEECKVKDYVSSYGGGGYREVARFFGWGGANRIADNKLINAGVIGGSAEKMISFFWAFLEERKKAGYEKFNINMPLVNYLLYESMGLDSVVVGEPVTSRYKAFETNREDVYFVHK